MVSYLAPVRYWPAEPRGCSSRCCAELAVRRQHRVRTAERNINTSRPRVRAAETTAVDSSTEVPPFSSHPLPLPVRPCILVFFVVLLLAYVLILSFPSEIGWLPQRSVKRWGISSTKLGSCFCVVDVCETKLAPGAPEDREEQAETLFPQRVRASTFRYVLLPFFCF